MPDDNFWENDAFATAGSANQASKGLGGRPKPTPQDMQDMLAASAKAQSERDALRMYGQARQAVKDFNTGPWKAKGLDMITPDEDGGFWDSIGGLIGPPLRAVGLVSDKTLAARDQLRTVNAKVALQGSQQMKGSSSDKDTALMRMGGISPYKSVGENLRIVDEATFDSGLEQLRAKIKSGWIGKFGSLANPRPDGVTFEQALAQQERGYTATMRAAMARKTGLPTPPPSVRVAPTGWRIEKAN